MVTAGSKPKLIAVIGPTASGKSELAMKIARQFNGEIICADSRTIYKGMDIGTAKPSLEDQKAVPHWGLDLVEPGRRFSAAQFQAYAKAAIADIQSRGRLPVLVGGTGLYVDGVLYDFEFKPAGKLRPLLALCSTKSLQKAVTKRGLPAPENWQNKRHLISAIERAGQAGSRQKTLQTGVVLVGLLPPDQVLKERIQKRAQQMFKNGVVAEAEQLLRQYGPKKLRQSGGIIYPILMDLLRSKVDQTQALSQNMAKEWQYARRQKTWFKRNPEIVWFDGPKAAFSHVKKYLLNN